MTTKELLLNEIEQLNPTEITELYTVAREIKATDKKLPHRSITRHPKILSGEPVITGTRTPVRAIVENWRMGIPPEEIPTHLPHLTLAQVFDALSYYSENQEEINGYIERNRVPDELIHRFAGKNPVFRVWWQLRLNMSELVTNSPLKTD